MSLPARSSVGDRAAKQMRTYVKFVNLHLPPEKRITSIADLGTSERLYMLMTEIYKRRGMEFPLRREKRTRAALRSRDQFLEVSDITRVLQLVQSKAPRGSVGIDAHQVHRGNPKSISALCWNVILNYYVFSDESVGRIGSPYRSVAKWVNDTIAPRHGRVPSLENWRRGGKDAWARVKPLFCLIETLTSDDSSPERAAFVRESERLLTEGDSPTELAQLCSDFAERAMDIPKLLEGEDFTEANLEERSITTYLSYFRNYARKKMEDLQKRKDYAMGLEKNIDQLRESLRDALQKLEESERRRHEEQQELNAVIDGMRKDLGENRKHVDRLTGSKEALGAVLAEKTERVDSLLKAVEDRDRKLSGLATQVDELKNLADVQRAEYRSDLDQLKMDRTAADDRWMAKNRELQDRLSQHECDLHEVASQRDKLQTDLKNSEDGSAVAQARLESELESAQKKRLFLEEDLSDRKQENAELHDRIVRQEDEIGTLKSAADRQTQQLDDLQRVKNDLEGELSVFTSRQFADVCCQVEASSRDKCVQTDPFFETLLDEKEKEIAALRRSTDELETKLRSETQRADRLSESHGDLVEKARALELEAVSRNRDLETRQRMLTEAQSDLDRLKKQSAQREDSLVRDRDQWKSLLDRKCEELKSVEERLAQSDLKLEEERRQRHDEKIETQNGLRKLELERGELADRLKRASEDAARQEMDRTRETQSLRDLIEAGNRNSEALEGRLALERETFQSQLHLKALEVEELEATSKKRDSDHIAEVDSLKQRLEERDDSLAEAQGKLASLEDQFSTGNRQWDFLRASLAHCLEGEKSKREAAENDLAALREEDSQLKTDLANVTKESGTQARALADLQDERARLLSSVEELSQKVSDMSGSVRRKDEAIGELERLREKEREDHDGVVADLRREKEQWKNLLSQRDEQLSESSSSLEDAMSSCDELRKDNSDFQRRIRELEDVGHQQSSALSRAQNDCERYRGLLNEKQEKVRELENLLYETKCDFEKFKLRNKLQMDDLSSLKSERDSVIEELEQKLTDLRSRNQEKLGDWKAKEDEWRRDKARLQEDFSSEIKSWQSRLRDKDLELTALHETTARDSQRQQQLLEVARSEVGSKDRSLDELQDTADRLRADLERSRRSLEEERSLSTRRLKDRDQQIEDGASRLADAMADLSRMKDGHMTEALQLRRDLEGVSKQLQDSERRCRLLQDEKSALTDDFSEVQNARASLESAALKKEASLNDVISSLRQVVADKELELSKASKSWDHDRGVLDAEVSTLKSDLKETRALLGETETHRDRLDGELSQVRSDFETCQQDAESESVKNRSEVSSLEARVSAVLGELAEVRENHQKQANQWGLTKSRLETDLSSSRAQEKELVENLGELKGLRQDAHSRIAGLEGELLSALNQVDRAGEEMRIHEEVTSREKGELREKLRITESDLESTRDHGQLVEGKLRSELEKLESMNEDLSAINEESQKQLGELSTELRERGEELIGLRRDQSSLVDDLRSARDSEDEKSARIEGLELKMADLRSSLNEERSKAAGLSRSKIDLEKSHADLEEAASSEISELESQRESANHRIAELERRLAEEEAQAKSLRIEHEADLSAARDDSSRLIAELKARLQDRDEEIVRLKARIVELEKLLEEKGADLRSATRSISELTNEQHSLHSDLENVRLELRGEREELGSAKEDLSRKESEFEALLHEKESEVSGLTLDLLEHKRRLGESEDRNRSLVDESDDLRQADEDRFVEMRKEMQDRLRQAESDRENLLSQLDESQSLISTMEQEGDDHLSEIEELKEELQMARSSFDDLLNDKETEAELARKRMDDLLLDHTRLAKEHDRRVRELESSLTDEKANSEDLGQGLDRLRLQLQDSERYGQSLSQDLADAKDSLLDEKRDRAADEVKFNSHSKDLQSDLSSLREELQNLRSSFDREKDRSSRLESDRDAALKSVEDETRVQLDLLDQKDREIEALREDLRSSSGVNADLDRLRDRLKSQTDEMSDMKLRFQKQMDAQFAQMNETLRARGEEMERLHEAIAERDARIQDLERRIAALLREKDEDSVPKIVVEAEGDSFVSTDAGMEEGRRSRSDAHDQENVKEDPFMTIDGDMEALRRARAPESVTPQTRNRRFNSSRRTDRFFHETRESYQLSQGKMMALTKDDIREIGGYRSPPKLVHDTCKCVLMLITTRSRYELDQWKICRSYMQRRMDFLRLVRGFKPQAYRGDIGEVRKIVSQIPKKSVARCSKCAAVLYEFSHCAVQLISKLRLRRAQSQKQLLSSSTGAGRRGRRRGRRVAGSTTGAPRSARVRRSRSRTGT